MRTGVLIRPATVVWACPRVAPGGGISESANQSPELLLAGSPARITATPTTLWAEAERRARWEEGGGGD